MTIGDRIRAKRQDLGLSVDELAARLGKNRATVYRYENGNIENLPVGILEPLATALETTPAYLIGLVDSAVLSTPSEPTITNNLPDKAKAALEQEDGQTAEIIELLLDLSADRRQEALNYLRYLSERADK